MPLTSWKPTQMTPRWDVFQRDPDSFHKAIVDMMCSALRVPVSMVSILHDNRHLVYAQHGLGHLLEETSELPITHSICQHVVAMGRPLVVCDAFAHPLVQGSPAVLQCNVNAYLGEPLHGIDGKPMGSLCVLDTRARDWSDSQRRMMSIAAMVAERALQWAHGKGGL